MKSPRWLLSKAGSRRGDSSPSIGKPTCTGETGLGTSGPSGVHHPVQWSPSGSQSRWNLWAWVPCASGREWGEGMPTELSLIYVGFPIRAGRAPRHAGPPALRVTRGGRAAILPHEVPPGSGPPPPPGAPRGHWSWAGSDCAPALWGSPPFPSCPVIFAADVTV